LEKIPISTNSATNFDGMKYFTARLDTDNNKLTLYHEQAC
jgi:hypothetical protein